MSATFFALDLTPATAPHSWLRQGDPDTEHFILSRVAGLASAAESAAFDLITIGGDFRLGGGRRRDEWLDAALAATRLAHHTDSITIAAGVPLGVSQPQAVAGAVGSVHKATKGRAAWQVEASELNPVNPQAVDQVLASFNTPNPRTGAVPSRPTIVVPVRTDADVEIAAARADVARIATSDIDQARALRDQIRELAHRFGRDADAVKVIVDTHVVLADDQAAAQARFDLFEAIQGVPQPPSLTIIGTAAQAITTVEKWIEAGAVDGVAFIPGSVPTDVLALARNVLPALQELHSGALASAS